MAIRRGLAVHPQERLSVATAPGVEVASYATNHVVSYEGGRPPSIACPPWPVVPVAWVPIGPVPVHAILPLAHLAAKSALPPKGSPPAVYDIAPESDDAEESTVEKDYEFEVTALPQLQDVMAVETDALSPSSASPAKKRRKRKGGGKPSTVEEDCALQLACGNAVAMIPASEVVQEVPGDDIDGILDELGMQKLTQRISIVKGLAVALKAERECSTATTTAQAEEWKERTMHIADQMQALEIKQDEVRKEAIRRAMGRKL